jgi:iron complex transport system substrate-binding protein
VVSAGSRLEPNLELLASLKPDLILSSPVLETVRPRLQAIAPVLSIDAFRQNEDHARRLKPFSCNWAACWDVSRRRLPGCSSWPRVLSVYASNCRRKGARRLPRVQVIRFANASNVYVYGSNAMPVLALRRLGLRTTSTAAASVWGISPQRVVDLVAWRDEVVLYQNHLPKPGGCLSARCGRACPLSGNSAWQRWHRPELWRRGVAVLSGAAHDGCFVAVAAAG